MKTKIIRVSKELSDEIERFAKLNDTRLVEASKEFAKLIRQNKNRKIIREIKF